MAATGPIFALRERIEKNEGSFGRP